MPKIQTRRAGRAYTCSRCAGTIAVGEEYLTAKPFRAMRVVAHSRCGIARSALTSSEGLGMAYDADDDLHRLSPTDFDEPGALAEAVRSVAQQGREAAEALEEKADEIDENFPGSPQSDERRDWSEEVGNWVTEIEGMADEIEELETGDGWQGAAEGLLADASVLNV